MRYADFVASQGDAAATTMRFLTKPHNSNPTVALTINSSQNATFAGTINSGAITSAGDISTTDGSGTFTISGDSSSNTYLVSAGEIRVRPSGTTVNKFVIGSNGNLTTAGTITSGRINVDHTDGTDNVSLTPTSTGGVILSLIHI